MLVSGVAIGALGTHLRYQREIRAAATEMKASPSGVRQFLLKRLTRHLDLDTAQQERIGAIVKETQEKELQPLFEEIKPRVLESLRNAEMRINELLTDEQKAKFKELTERRDRRPLMPPEGGASGAPPRPPLAGQRGSELGRATKAALLYYIVRHAASEGERPFCLISSWGTRVMPAGAAVHRGLKFRDLARVADYLVATAEESPVTVSAYLGDAFDDPQKILETLTPPEIAELHALISARRRATLLQDEVIFLGRKNKD